MSRFSRLLSFTLATLSSKYSYILTLPNKFCSKRNCCLDHVHWQCFFQSRTCLLYLTEVIGRRCEWIVGHTKCMTLTREINVEVVVSVLRGLDWGGPKRRTEASRLQEWGIYCEKAHMQVRRQDQAHGKQSLQEQREEHRDATLANGN